MLKMEKLPYKISICTKCFNLLLKGPKSKMSKCKKCCYKPMILFVRKDYIHNYVRLKRKKYNNITKGKHYKKISIKV